MEIIAIVVISTNDANTDTNAPLLNDNGACVFCGYEHLGGDC